MSLAHRSVALAFMLAVAAGCSSAESSEVGASESANTQARQGAAPVGVPSAPVFGEQAYGAAGAELRIKKADGSTLVRKMSGYSPLTIENGAFGPALPQSPDQRAGWQTGAAKWKCQDAERFATDAVTYTDPNQLCHVEINPTGGDGFSITIIGLDASGRGISSYAPPSASPVPAAVNGGAVLPVASGPAQAVNVTMDHDAVLDAMLALRTKFNASKAERNDCLKNARASNWLDIQAHYYCLLPYNDIRTCYSTKLIEQASSSDATTRARAALTAYATCFAPPTNGAQDVRTAAAKWLHENQGAVFKYVMFTKQGVVDYELTSESQTISDYYARIGEPRPRRVNDTFPEWLPKQPRYVAIQKLQSDAQRQGGR